MTGACKEAEEGPQYFICAEAFNLEYRNFASNQPHRLNITHFMDTILETRDEVMVVVYSELDGTSKIKMYDNEQSLKSLCEDISARAKCYGASEPMPLIYHLLLVSYLNENGNYCDLPLTIEDPITQKMEELYLDVMATGDDNELSAPHTSTKD